MDYINYTFKTHDSLNRMPIAKKAILLLEADIDISPMVIDGAWGTGKSVFAHQMMALMKRDGTHDIVYIDAFKADHTGEPLITVLSHLINLLPPKDKINFKKKAMPVLKQSLKVIGKAGVAHILKADTDSIAADYDKEINILAGKSIDALVDSVLQSQVDAKKNVDILAKAISDIATKKPIVIFIDELDRCRPDFALSLLEVVKHVFDVEGVQFVLVTNIEHLRASVNHMYGSFVDSQRYLDKFLKFTFTLPSNIDSNQSHADKVASVNYFKKLVREKSLPDNLTDDFILEFFKRLVIVNSISLREVESIVRILLIHKASSEDSRMMIGGDDFLSRCIVLFGAVLFCLKSEYAKNVLNNRADAQELANMLEPDAVEQYKKVQPFMPNVYTGFIGSIGPECEINAGKFTATTEENKKKWQQYKEDVFSNRFGFEHEDQPLLENLRQFLRSLNLTY